MNVRKWLLAAAAGAALAPLGASAATIVAGDTESIMLGIPGFDATLGTLNKVTLDVSVQKYRVWILTAPAGSLVGSTASVGWTVDSSWGLGSSNFGTPGFTVAITGAGSSDVTFRTGPSSDYGYFQVSASGSGSTTFDPALFVSNRRVYFNGFDNGFYGDPAGTALTNLPANVRPIPASGACRLGSDGPLPPFNDDDMCGTVRYTLSYDYTPFGAAVPEPATWAMMVLGFGLAGAAIRRRRRADAHAAA
ncbi:PEPxxWA-CTERM sorting domain-containing protein [Sphingomonas sp. RHCKR7]|uniref:PEPxxWA-CTERM sorting domain-containing protein n=1 Tax=Sphingomonas folli TaxID=2862497 RepID=UPI001CA4D5CA|nr:PEPxxWA-CTERM sorting domain-containing protein [Sphingomonas folli]MBW6525273.1 PEPxxWA-CTERM sorting domain-containing protein [Sphingomonas folli]